MSIPSARNPLWRTYGLYRRHLGLVGLVVLLSLAANASFGYQQHLFGQTFEHLRLLAIGEAPADRLGFWCMVVLLFTVGRAVAAYATQIVGSMLGQRLLFQLRSRLFHQVVELDQRFHREHGGGELIARTTRDSDKVRDAVVIGTRQLLDTLMIIIGGLAFLFWCHPLLGLVQGALIGIAAWMLVHQADRLVKLNRATDDSYDRVTQDFTEGVIGVRVIKAFNHESARLAHFRRLLRGFMDHARRALLYTATRLPVPQAVVAMGHAWILYYGGVLVADGSIDSGTYIAALMLVTGLVFRMDGIGRVVRIMAEARASAARVWQVLDARTAVRSGESPLPAGPLGLRLDGVRVAPGEHAILADCSLAVAPGEVVALVGPTGSGKSTLCSLFPRLRDPDGGQVLIGSDASGWQSVADCRIDALRQAVQVAYQGSFLFSDSVAGNLRLADASADERQLWHALHLAAAEDIVKGLPEGLATRIGERGLTLSGGQRQRLALARALVADPAVLILDDATSALDAHTEAAILARLRRALGQTTVLMVATRLASIHLADRVLVLDEGRIIAAGSHAELVASSPAYRRLLALDREEAA